MLHQFTIFLLRLVSSLCSSSSYSGSQPVGREKFSKWVARGSGQEEWSKVGLGVLPTVSRWSEKKRLRTSVLVVVTGGVQGRQYGRNALIRKKAIAISAIWKKKIQHTRCKVPLFSAPPPLPPILQRLRQTLLAPRGGGSGDATHTRACCAELGGENVF